MQRPYIRDPKGKAPKGKWETNEEDQEDFAQEQLIQEWLRKEGADVEFEFKHISRKGTARNTIDKRSIRLDAKVSDENGSRTYADIIAGSDGRDLECGLGIDQSESKTPEEELEEAFDLFFDAIGVGEGTKQWAKKSIKSAESLRSLRSLMKEEEQFEISLINLESPRQWSNFRK